MAGIVGDVEPGLSYTELSVLRATPAIGMTPSGPNNIGMTAWESTRKYASCSAPYARPAGKVLRRLLARGLVARVDDFGRWQRTTKGEGVVAYANRVEGDGRCWGC
jgi:hypothetical protein